MLVSLRLPVLHVPPEALFTVLQNVKIIPLGKAKVIFSDIQCGH